MSAEELVIHVFVGFVGGILLVAWNLRDGKKKDSNPKEYRDEDPIPFDEIP